MPFVDYYGVLNIGRTATEPEINDAFLKLAQSVPPPDIFTQAIAARETLINSKTRKLYDQAYGYILIIQTRAEATKNQNTQNNYILSRPLQPHLSLLALRDDFQNWVIKKTGLDWSEAEHLNYSSEITSNPQALYLTLRSPDEKLLNLYAKKLVDERKIKK